MSVEEFQEEWEYRFQERLGIMAGPAEPTGDQAMIAMQEADEALFALGYKG